MKKASSLLLLVSLLLQRDGPVLPVTDAQTPQDVHPWLQECSSYGCPTAVDNKHFCNFTTDTCVSCPKNGINASISDCEELLMSSSSNNDTSTLDDCLASCVRSQEGEACSYDNNMCDEGKLFCNFSNESNTDTDLSSGTCEPCKTDATECLLDDTIENAYGVEDCFKCDMDICIPLHFSVVTATAEDDDDEGTVLSNAMEGSPSLVASGPMVKCTNLIHEEETTCDGGDISVDGAVCLVDVQSRNTYYVGVVHKCTQLGGVATIFYGDQSDSGIQNNETWRGSLSYKDSFIPSVVIPYNDGKRFEQKMLGTVAVVNVSDVGETCWKHHFCSESIPCLGEQDGRYCNYKWGGEKGFCTSCPDEPLKCFFSDNRDVLGQKGVEDCAAVCASSLEFPKCKLCPEDVNGFDFGVDSPDAGICDFCPENDVLYPDNVFPLFGENITCWQVQKFFQTVDVNADAPNCKLARAANYMCGCKGPGYAGASTEVKKKVLVWLPRVMAMLSLLSSTFIIIDASRAKKRREKLLYQLLIGLSAFDIVGSCAYMVTTSAVPEDDLFRVFGARGNDATCSAQGFFIQVGTISAYMNVAVSVYYFLVIARGWNDTQVKKYRWLLFLAPILVGFAFAFAGIPFYGNMILWCNNTALYWPEIPVLVSIAIATVIMGIVCWHVYQNEKVSKRWRGGAGAGARDAGRTQLSTRVFWQSIWYLMAFYLTWPVYVALQYSWARGAAFTNYGFVLAAATMVPTQGFWNMLAYSRPRYFQSTFDAVSRRVVSTWQLSYRSSSRMPTSMMSSPKTSEVTNPTTKTATRSHRDDYWNSKPFETDGTSRPTPPPAEECAKQRGEEAKVEGEPEDPAGCRE